MKTSEHMGRFLGSSHDLVSISGSTSESFYVVGEHTITFSHSYSEADCINGMTM